MYVFFPSVNIYSKLMVHKLFYLFLNAYFVISLLANHLYSNITLFITIINVITCLDDFLNVILILICVDFSVLLAPLSKTRFKSISRSIWSIWELFTICLVMVIISMSTMNPNPSKGQLRPNKNSYSCSWTNVAKWFDPTLYTSICAPYIKTCLPHPPADLALNCGGK